VCVPFTSYPPNRLSRVKLSPPPRSLLFQGEGVYAILAHRVPRTTLRHSFFEEAQLDFIEKRLKKEANIVIRS